MVEYLYLGISSHYSDVIIRAMASQITGVSIVCSALWSGADQTKHQSTASLAFVRGIHRLPASNAENVSIWWRHHVKIHQNTLNPDLSRLGDFTRSDDRDVCQSLCEWDMSSRLLRIRQWISNHRKSSNISRTKSPNLNVSRLVLQLSLPNPMKTGVKSRMKM